MSNEMYGWFSQQQADLFGSIKYLTPEGKEVTVSQVSSSSKDSHTKWDDIKFVSRVTTVIDSSRSPGSEDWINDVYDNPYFEEDE